MTHIVLVGGGHAHLSVLQALSQRHLDDVFVTLITPDRYLSYSGMVPGWMAGHYLKEQCRIDLKPLVSAANVNMVIGRVVGINADRCCVALTEGYHIEYDLLSLDTGSEIDTSWLEMAGSKLLPIKPLDHFFNTWPTIMADALRNPDYRLVVVGGGAAGIELTLAAAHAFKSAGIVSNVALVTSSSGLAVQGQKTRQRLLRQLIKAGVTLHQHKAVGSEDGLMLSDGSVLPADCVLAATGARAPYWLKLSHLDLDENGYVAVNQYHQSLSHPNVFAAGDVCSRQDVKLARSGVHAVHAGPVLAHNLIAMIKSKPLKPYRPRKKSLYILACGARYAVATWGSWSLEGSWVWYCKNWIDRRFIRRFSEF